MRKLIWCGALILAVCIVALGLGPRCMYRPADGEPEVRYDEEYTPPAEPQLVAEVLPEQPVPIPPTPQVEVINVLETQLAALRIKEGAQNVNAEPEPDVPVMFAIAEEEYRPMPFCIDEEEECPPKMPYTDETPAPSAKAGASEKPKEAGRTKEGRMAIFAGFLPLPF